MMVETNEQVLEEVRQQGDMLMTRELVSLIERHHSHEQGVSRETIEAYDEAITNDDTLSFESGEVTSAVENRSVEGETWVDDQSLYSIGDDRVSAFPARWHEKLGETTDLRAYVSLIGDVMEGEGKLADPYSSDPEDDEGASGGGLGSGVPEQLVLDAVSVIGGTERDAVKEQLEERRTNGELVQDADQHPDARVYLSEETEEMGDDWLDY